MGVGGKRHTPAALPQGMTQYPFYRRLDGPQDRYWMGAENVALTGIRSPTHPARSESLYRLRYPGPLKGSGGKSILNRNFKTQEQGKFSHYIE
jgi:hypothetical protein